MFLHLKFDFVGLLFGLDILCIMGNDITLKIIPDVVHPDVEIKGTITVSYPGKYDGVVISAQISDSNEHITYKSSNGKPISQNVARLFIGYDTMTNNAAEFTAVISFEPKSEHEVKFRASVIEQHKEIDSKIIFTKYMQKT